MAIYFFDKNQTLIKIVPKSATFEAIQTQELDDDSLLKDTLSVTVKGDEKLLNAEYMAVKSYTGNAQTFDMYRIVTDATPDKSMSFTGMSLAPYELNGHILQDLRPANRTLEFTLNRILNGTDWRVGYIDSNLSNVTTTFYYVSAKEALKELQSLVGCEFVFKVEISGQKITDKWIEVYKEMGNRTKKRFNYGTNALTVVRETNKTDIYTALIGRGKGEEVSSGSDNASGQAGYGRKITFEDIEWSTTKGNPLNKPKGQYYLELPQATQVYGIKNIDGTMKARVGIVDFDDEEDKNRLVNLTYQQLLVSSRPKVLFKTTVANVGATGIGDTVTIHRHDLNIHYQTRVRKIVRNKLNDNKTQIELGDAVVTPSTKQAKQNNATIKNLNQEIEKVKADVTISQTSADGQNTITYGPIEPTRKRTGDTWYRPHPSIAGETQTLVWDGNAWELLFDTSDLTAVSRKVEVAKGEAEKASQAAKEADGRANTALEKAGANANLITTHQNTIDTINTTTLPDISSTAGNALADAKSAMDEAKKADEKIANYVKENGLVNGTTVDSKIDTAKGEITGRITTLETNKLDSTTYTNFYENDYKRTAKGVTDTWTAVNKIVDKDGNATDSFAKAVYDQNATRRTADFQTVTNDLVKTATYEDGIDGVKKSITTVQGKLDNLGSPNLLKESWHNNIDSPPIVNTNYTIINWKLDKPLVVGKTYTFRLFGFTNREYFLLSTANAALPLVYGMTNTSDTVIRRENAYNGLTNRNVWEKTFTLTQAQADNMTSNTVRLYNYPQSNTGNGEVYWATLVEGKAGIDWSPAISDQLGKAEFTIFKNDYDETAKSVERRLTAIDSDKEGSFLTRLNKTESTANGNTTTISNIKTKPGEQITGYQTIKERSDLYERVIGSTDETGVKGNISRIVQASGIIQSEVASAVPNPNLLSGTDFKEGLGDVLVYNRAPTLSEASYFPYGKVATIQTPESSGTANVGFAVKIPKKDTWYTLSFYGLANWVGSKGVGFYSEYMKSSKNYKAPTLNGSPSRHRIQITVQVTLDNAWLFVSPQGNTFGPYANIVYYGVKLDLGEVATPWENSDPASSSKITQLAKTINLKVSDSELLSRINMQAGSVLIQSGTNKLNVTPETTYIEDSTIKSAMIESLLADKITTGTLDAAEVNIINLDANNITANKTSFIQSNWNDIESSIKIDGRGLLSTARDGSQVYLQNGIVGARNPSGATIGQIGYAYQTESPWYSMQISHGSHFQIRMNRAEGELNKQAFYIISGGTESYLNTDNIYFNPSATGRVRVQGAMTVDKDLRVDGTILVRSRLEYLNGGYIESQAANSNILINATNKLIIYTNGTNALEFDANNAVFRRKISDNSDIRLKTNIVDMPINSLEAIRNIEIKKFDYLDGRKNYYGIIAQQAQQYLPELINTDSEGYLMVDKSAMTYVNMHAIQQLNTKVDDEITQLKAQIASLQDELALLKGA